ncbi:MAG: MFS transporter [Verrucomicrobiales bacterium]|nr:MFS transporter [Verrucomicrobiales bacterium]
MISLPKNYVRLSAMMFLQFGIYGLWLPIAGKFLTADPSVGGLGFNETQMGMIVGIAASIGALCSPFIVQFADRRFSAQRVLGILMMIGGILKMSVYPQSTFLAWLLLSVSFTLMFMPAAAICNALAMRHLDDPGRQFPGVRLWTAVGWVLMGWSFSFLVLKTNVTGSWLPPFFKGDDVPMVMGEMKKSVMWSGIMAFGYGVWAFFFLPDTPPIESKSQRPAVADAFALLKIPSIAVLLAVTLIISPMNTIYFMQCAKFLGEAGLDSAYLLPAMAIGQICEIVMYLVLGRLLPKIGFKQVLAIGIGAYVFRFFLFGTIGIPMWVIIFGLGIHGLCYAFFTSTCFIYMNKIAAKDVANTAQSVFNFIWYGIGPLLAVGLNSLLAYFFASGKKFAHAEFQSFWYSLGAISLVGMIVFLLKFREEKEAVS